MILLDASTRNDTLPPLERFIRDYAERLAGGYELVEPEVYDVLVEDGIQRLTFDPEALPEHDNAQLATLGSPLLDRMLADASARGRRSTAYRFGLNLHPHDLAGKLQSAVRLDKGLELNVLRARALHVHLACFWFEATFVADEREQEQIVLALDLHQQREVRHLDRLLVAAQLSPEPVQPLPPAPSVALRQGLSLACRRALPVLNQMLSARRRKLAEFTERHVARMERYYDQMLAEMAERPAREKADEERLRARQQSIQNERTLRVAEMRQKSQVASSLALRNVLSIHQPKLLASAELKSPRSTTPLTIVWDPLLEAVEAIPCPSCRRPTFAFVADRLGKPRCESCA